MYGKSSRKPLLNRQKTFTSTHVDCQPKMELDDQDWNLILHQQHLETKEGDHQKTHNEEKSSKTRSRKNVGLRQNQQESNYSTRPVIRTISISPKKHPETDTQNEKDLLRKADSHYPANPYHKASNASPMKRRNTGRTPHMEPYASSDETVTERSLTPPNDRFEENRFVESLKPAPVAESMDLFSSSQSPLKQTHLSDSLLGSSLSPVKLHPKGRRVARMKAAAPSAEPVSKKKIPLARPVSFERRDSPEKEDPVQKMGISGLSLDSPRKSKNPLDPCIPAVIPIQRTNSAKFTYGERRTILAHQSIAEQNETTLDNTQRTMSIDDILAGGGADTSAVLDEGLSTDDDESSGPTIKSSHVLRAAGEVKRFKDELEYLLDGLSPSQPLKVRIATCLSLCQKAKVDNFIHFLDAHNHICTLLELLHDASDSFLRAMFLYLVSVWTSASRNFESISNFQEFTCSLILDSSWEAKQDPLVSLPTKKLDQRQVKQFIGILENAFPESSSLTMADLSIKANMHVFRTLQAALDDQYLTILGDSFTLTSVISILISENDLELSFLQLERLAFLDTILSIPILRSVVCQKYPQLGERIVKHGKQLMQLSLQEERHHLGMQYLLHVLRILTNITHDFPKALPWDTVKSWIPELWNSIQQTKKTLIRNDSEEDGDHEETSKILFDLSLLTTTLAVNLIEHGGNANMVTDLQDARLIACTKEKVCQRSCKCEAVLFSQHLIHCFQQLHQVPNEEKSVEDHVLMGYLAVLLGSLYKHSSPSSRRVMFGPTTSTDLNTIIQVLESFAAFYEIVGKHEETETVGSRGVYESRTSIVTLVEALKGF